MPATIFGHNAAPEIDSLIVSEVPSLLEELRAKRSALPWRGRRDSFGPIDFHRRCDGRVSTLVLVLDTDGTLSATTRRPSGSRPSGRESTEHNKTTDMAMTSDQGRQLAILAGISERSLRMG
jgi:hypothetical protein